MGVGRWECVSSIFSLLLPPPPLKHKKEKKTVGGGGEGEDNAYGMPKEGIVWPWAIKPLSLEPSSH